MIEYKSVSTEGSQFTEEEMQPFLAYAQEIIDRQKAEEADPNYVPETTEQWANRLAHELVEFDKYEREHFPVVHYPNGFPDGECDQ